MVLANNHVMVDNSSMTAERVLSIRTDQEMTQEEFALLLGTSPMTIWRWENGRSRPVSGYRILLDLVERGIYPEK